jgi:hypothetical protein
MFGKEELNEEMKAFEAALAGLRPRGDGLDPRWRFLLAEEARLNQTLSKGSEIGSLSLWERVRVRAVRRAACEDGAASDYAALTRCPSPKGRGENFGDLRHGEALAAEQAFCSRCGDALSGGRGRRRWAWPAAFSAMTAVAAILLAALVVRVEPRTAAPGRGAGGSSVATSVAERTVDPSPALAVRDIPRRSSVAAETAYLNLRDHVLRFGIESWKPPASSVAAKTNGAEPILSCREQLDLLWAGEGGS